MIETIKQKLSAGEIAAYRQGKLIISYEQLAVCYLVAKYAINEQEPKFSQKFSNSFGIESGMNNETYRRCVEKYKLLFTGDDEDEQKTDKEAIYPKIKNTYLEFYELPEFDVYAIAERSFTEENQKIGLAVAADKAANTDLSNAEYKQKDKEIRSKAILLYNSLFKVYRDQAKAKRQTIGKIAQELNINADRVERVWNKDEMLKIIK